MPKAIDLIREGKNRELWQMCCGFIDLSMDEFMDIQNRLLIEQMRLLQKCRLGQKIFQGATPTTVDEFRRQIPLTTYADYCDDLLTQRADILPVKPDFWIQTSGRSGEYPHKLVPVNQRFWEEAGKNFCAIALFSSCSKAGEIKIEDGDKLLHAASQKPFLTGTIACKLQEDLGLTFLPSLETSDDMQFEKRIEQGLRMALSEGMMGFYGLAGVLVAIGEKLRSGSGNTNLKSLLSRPEMLARLVKGKLKSRLAGRPMLPRDLWNLKLIVSMGTDCTIYRDRIRELWGRTPLEVYGNSETVVIATQTWDYSGLVFFPNLNFLEFVPEKEYAKWQLDHTYAPKTVLLDQVKPDENYELIITNFHGGALVRYRIGDMVRITGLKNDALGIALPQMTFERRADDLIDLGFARLTERVIWQAIENAGIPYKEWTAHKVLGENARLRLYLEVTDGYNAPPEEIADSIYREIKKMDDGLYVYSDITLLEDMIHFKPIEVSILPVGSFSRYKNRKIAEGTELAHLKPPHINPSSDALSLLLSGKNERSHTGKFSEKVS
jgi:hypothetical protein